jgi:phosphatidylinositol glycan class A protein
MMILTEPRVSDLIEKVDLAIQRHKSGDKIDPIQMHNEIKKMYNWRDVARRTEIVYNRVVKEYKPNQGLVDKLLKFRRCGYVGYYAMAFIYIIDYLVLLLHEFFNPASKIDRALDASEYKKYIAAKHIKQLK